jgi:hypothetical protein
MAQPIFTNNPSDFAALDGIYIDETTPPGRVNGINSGIALVIGEFERGPEDINNNPLVGNCGSGADIIAQFGGRGANKEFIGYLGLVNKKMTSLRIKRVIPASAVRASLTLSAAVRIDANSKGAWGNNVAVTVAAGTTTGKLITVTYTPASPGVQPDVEVFDNVPATPASQAALNAGLRGASGAGVGASKYVNFVWLAASAISNASSTGLASGANGSVAASDYTAALTAIETSDQADVMIVCFSNPPDAFRATINAAMVTHAVNFPGQICIVAGQSTDSVAAAVTTSSALADLQNLIYCFNHPQTVLDDGTTVTTGPETWLASLRSQQLPELSAADPDTVPMLAGISGLTFPSLTRTNYITLKANGIAAIDSYDPDLGGYKFKSSCSTYWPVALTKGTDEGYIERRHFASFIELSVARRLKAFQNKPLPLNPDGTIAADHLQIVAEIQSFYADMQASGRIAGFKIDPISGNTQNGLNAGIFVIIQKIKMNPRADSIVLRSQVGNSVSVA